MLKKQKNKGTAVDNSVPQGVLFVIYTPGGQREDNVTALVPKDMLDYMLDCMELELSDLDNFIVNVDDDEDPKVADAITLLYKRFGLERSDTVKPDLRQYLNTEPPYVVNEVIRIGWAV